MRPIISLSKSKPNWTNWIPKETHHIVKRFIDLVQHDINKIKTKKVKNPISNLSNREQEAMKHLAKQRHIIITTADKGDAVVNMDTENYIKEANCQLSDKNNYITIQTHPNLQHNKTVNGTLD